MKSISITNELHADYTNSAHFNAEQHCIEEGELPRFCDVEFLASVNFYADKGLSDYVDLSVAFDGRVTLTQILEALDAAYEDRAREIGLDENHLRYWYVDGIREATESYTDEEFDSGVLRLELELGT